MNTEPKKKPAWVKFINWISEISGYLGGISIFLATLIIVYQVFVRFVLGKPTIWQTELSVYLLMFATFIGASYGLKHGSHVGVDVIVEKLSPRGKSAIRIVTSFLSILLTIVLSWKAWALWWHVTEQGWTSSSLWAPPLTFPYFILPLGMTLLSLQFLAILYEEASHFKNNGASS
ncbi:TRAP transporter small permease [Bacillus piscicola]|uniref:TRAP transporter small permease n=1 Tax=Bacillus piscicola TaxID=1632684 RepID=UPI001F08EF8C|nr:TRAP transporter small permease [Bacillus piscicola]